MMKKENTLEQDIAALRGLNAQFIQNFISQDTVSHNAIIHPDFVCIESSGAIVDRQTYIKDWATAFYQSGYVKFGITDEFIRVFGNMALVRSKTNYTRVREGVSSAGSTIYTDTYVKDNGKWLCVQAQITPIK
jgi:hypothetical protein